MKTNMKVFAVLALLVPIVVAGPICGHVEENPETGVKTWNAIKAWFNPMCKYITQELPTKTPAVLVTDAKETIQDVKLWAKENEMVQTLNSALNPIKTWVKDTKDTLKDKTFKEMYEDVKTSVKNMDDKVGTWLADKTSNDENNNNYNAYSTFN